MEDTDANCRLRHGLNVHCLAYIFQYLDTPDLFTLGGMNEVYQQIITDLVMPRHRVNFDKLNKQGITISNVFERYGKNIRRIYFNDLDENHTVELLTQSMSQHCSIDQLKSVTIHCMYRTYGLVDLPIQCQNVERLAYCSGQISVQLSASLRGLILAGVDIYSKFDWTQLKNLKELYLYKVRGINTRNFIEFLRHRPNLKIFHHDADTFEKSTQEICNALAKFCANRIRTYSGIMPSNRRDVEASAQHLYNFISEFRNVKDVSLTTQRKCGSDLIDALKRLAENDTIETICIRLTDDDRLIRQTVNCNMQERTNVTGSRTGLDMRQFSHLKTITFFGYRWRVPEYFQRDHICDQFKILNVYSAQILANVEKLTIAYAVNDWNFIKFAKKLRYLKLFAKVSSDQAAEILSTLQNILRERKNGHTTDDFIEIKFDVQDIFESFCEINGCNDSIKLSMWQWCDSE